MDINEQLRTFIVSNTSLDSLSDDEDLFESGAVSSMFIMQIIAWVEMTTGAVVQGEDLSFDNFRSLNAIRRMISLPEKFDPL